MAEKTENYRTEYHSLGYYQKLVELRMQANKLLTELEFNSDPETQEQFKQVLSLLTKEMDPKYQRRQDIEKPEILQENEDLDMSEVNVKECSELLRSFTDLQEKLGITSMAKNEWEINEKGAVKKE